MSTLILIPGLLSDREVFRHPAAHLNDLANISIVKWSDEDTPEKMVQKVLHLAPPRFSLTGHSMGGWVALEVMRRARDRVEKLCLLNTTARSDSEEKLNRRKQWIQAVEKGGFHQVAEELTTAFVHRKEVRDAVLSMFLRQGPTIFINQERAMIMRQECFSILPKIKCPLLLIHARSDRNFSLEEQQEIAKKVPQAKVAIVEDAGHMMPMEMPQAVTALIRYWLLYFI